MEAKACFMRGKDEWETPEDFFEELDREFHFDLDPCASEENHKCENYLTYNGLQEDWGGHRVYCNPPYSEIAKWVEKGFRESRKDHTLVVMLIPSRTDTRWFHNFIYGRSEVRFVKGRLRFGGSKMNAPFPNMVVIFRGAYA